MDDEIDLLEIVLFSLECRGHHSAIAVKEGISQAARALASTHSSASAHRKASRYSQPETVAAELHSSSHPALTPVG